MTANKIKEKRVKKLDKNYNLRKLRRSLGMNQHEFWSAVGVTQSGGSRYETGRSLSNPVRDLVRLVHLEGIDLAKARGDHCLAGAELQRSNPTLYKKLLQQAQARRAR
jgi:transcriptional regulator with XRE-family HTH domain